MKKVRLLILGTLLSHFFILFGLAHGGAFIGVIEIIYFPYITNEHFTLELDGTQQSSLSVVGLFGFIGNLCLCISILIIEITTRNALYFIGLLSYWISIIYLWYDSASLGHSQFSFLFCVPLLIFTVIPVLRKYIFKYDGWVKN